MQTVDESCPPKRCAIYTRRSFQPPLGQEVTSLESQRAICSAYVASQQHKGWMELAKHYEDSGQSGSTMDRPALQELIADIELGNVEVVVIYKIDRISRTLLDFVRLIDFFEKYAVSFVAITQNFDTGDSMGRLVQNILLTFAQFEREIACDRMRDKKLVMKQRGLWTGGDAPLGYDLQRGKLIVNPREAAAVCRIFETYVETGCPSEVHKRLITEGYRRKIWKAKTGLVRGGGPISLSSLHHILGSPIYIGQVSHKGSRYPGVHQPIVEQTLWDQAQAILESRSYLKPRQAHLLSGMVIDGYGRRMHVSGPQPGIDYVSSTLNWAVRQKIRPCRVRADQLEPLVLDVLKSLFADKMKVRQLLMELGEIGCQLDGLSDGCTVAGHRLRTLNGRALRSAVMVLIYRVELAPERVRILVRKAAVRGFLCWDGVGLFQMRDLDLAQARQLHIVDVCAELDRRRRRDYLPIAPRTSRKARPSLPLIRILDEARKAQRNLFENRDMTVAEVACSNRRKPGAFSRLIRLNYLAPDIVAAIIDGSQPRDLTAAGLMKCDLPMDWDLQRRMLGFPAVAAVMDT